MGVLHSTTPAESQSRGSAISRKKIMTEINVAAIVPPQTQPRPVEQSTCEPLHKSADETETPFPRRVNLDTFPNPPAQGFFKLPGTLENVAHLLRECEITVSYDVIKKKVSISRNAVELEESDLTSLANLNGLAPNWMLDYAVTLARRNTVNPVALWIDSKPWDGIDRLQALLDTVQVQEEYPIHARDFLIRRWLLSCVAAALKPSGFKSRGVLTLQGEQGCGKTSWVARLVPEAQTAEWVKLDHHLDAHNKDSIFGAVTHWITEIGELDSSFRKDIARIKGFLTNTVDKIRLPYAKSAVELERRTVFAGTVNEWHFLIDQTGNSRWWTIAVASLDYEHDIDMQQLFAQLAIDFRNGAQWWLTDHEESLLASLNSQHQSVSVIEERLRSRIAPEPAKHRYMTATQVLEEVGMRYPSNSQCKECGAILRSIYGAPKRVQGLMKWKVALTPESVWEKHPDDDPSPEDIY